MAVADRAAPHRVPVDQGFAETLAAYGVEFVFGMKVFQELDTSTIQPIVIHFEGTASLMAYGYARISGKPGIVAINKPGNPNVLMGMHEAWQSSVPLIVHVDGMAPAQIGKHATYEHDTAGVVRVFSKAIVDAWAPATYPEQLRKAFRVATTGRPGPVVFHQHAGERFERHAGEVEVFAEPQYMRYPAHRTPPEPEAIERAVEALLHAERPGIVAGGGIYLSRAWDELRALADLLDCPVATTISGKGAFDEHDPRSVGSTGDIQGGRYGRGRVAAQVIKECDTVLLVGTRTNQMATNSWTLPDPSSTLIHLDIDPENIGRNYRPEVELLADAKVGLQALTAALVAAGYQPRPSRSNEIRQLLDTWSEDSSLFMGSTQVPIHPGRLVHEVSKVVGANTILVSDGSSPFMWASSHILVDAGPTFISPRGTGAIGTGLPMAMGAKLAAPARDVICFEGDGGITCGILSELETAARHRIGVTTIVFNNATLGHERVNYTGPQGDAMDFLPGIDFAKVAEGLRCEGIRVEQPEELAPAIARGLENGRQGKPTLLDVVLHHDQYLRLPFGGTPTAPAGPPV
ncbi:MAG: acetolactate synthase large subunit [Chloroflexota bacterium]|jgi:acetolactate synthase-1/2/3 large subunit|nr:acetolactate synthase large subunit [Chloroflexota bacterium]